MAKFNWKTEGSRPTMTSVSWPPAVILLLVVGAAVLVAILVTGHVSKNEKDSEAKQPQHEQTRSRTCAIWFIQVAPVKGF